MTIDTENDPLLSATIYYTGDYSYSVNADGVTCTITNNRNKTGNIVIPEIRDGYKVTAIGDSAFSYAMNLTGVTILDTVTSIGNIFRMFLHDIYPYS